MAFLELPREDEETLSYLAAGLDDSDALVRRTAFRILLGMGPSARNHIVGVLRSPDADMRRMALHALDASGEVSVDDLQAVLSDEAEMVRREAVRVLGSITPRTSQVENLLREAGSDRSPVVRAEVLRGMLGEPQTKSVRGEHIDRAIDVIRTLPLPAEGWKLKLDPDGMGRGHILGWFEKSFDDSGWEDTRIETAWEPGYVGVGWYRGAFDLPAAIDCDGVEIYFAGVDESAWVWINGIYVGERDIGPEGWDVPFTMDISDVVRWGERNQVTVRVMNTRMAGGIWMPVELHFLRVR